MELAEAAIQAAYLIKQPGPLLLERVGPDVELVGPGAFPPCAGKPFTAHVQVIGPAVGSGGLGLDRPGPRARPGEDPGGFPLGFGELGGCLFALPLGPLARSAASARISAARAMRSAAGAVLGSGVSVSVWVMSGSFPPGHGRAPSSSSATGELLTGGRCLASRAGLMHDPANP
jgi:hypothetical protein